MTLINWLQHGNDFKRITKKLRMVCIMISTSWFFALFLLDIMLTDMYLHSVCDCEAKRQRTIQVMDIHEIPKPKNSFIAKNKGGGGSGSHQGRHW